ncbi:hypothetical protein FQA39_LY19373 [Lamprigera yunnana]|nr:hypothetical protein FQA39_LY19373 [Lamprigera yunnana]
MAAVKHLAANPVAGLGVGGLPGLDGNDRRLRAVDPADTALLRQPRGAFQPVRAGDRAEHRHAVRRTFGALGNGGRRCPGGAGADCGGVGQQAGAGCAAQIVGGIHDCRAKVIDLAGIAPHLAGKAAGLRVEPHAQQGMVLGGGSAQLVDEWHGFIVEGNRVIRAVPYIAMHAHAIPPTTRHPHAAHPDMGPELAGDEAGGAALSAAGVSRGRDAAGAAAAGPGAGGDEDAAVQRQEKRWKAHAQFGVLLFLLTLQNLLSGPSSPSASQTQTYVPLSK